MVSNAMERSDMTSCARDATRLQALALWYTTPSGRAEMSDKSYVNGSVHRSLICDVLNDAIDNGGQDPIAILRRALVVLSAELGGDDRLIAASETLKALEERGSHEPKRC